MGKHRKHTEGDGHSSDDPSYDVGYGKPPQHSRFKPGQSGNTKGRPKKDRSFAAHLRAELNEMMEVVEQGRRKKMTKAQALFKSLIMRAMKGEANAYRMLMLLLKDLHLLRPDPPAAGGLDAEIGFDPKEELRRRIDLIIERAQQNDEGPPEPE